MKRFLVGLGMLLGIGGLGVWCELHEAQRLADQVAQQRALLVEADQAAAALRLAAESLEPHLTGLHELEVRLRVEQDDWRAEDEQLRRQWRDADRAEWQQLQRIVLRSLDPTAIRLSAVEAAHDELRKTVERLLSAEPSSP